MPVALCGAAVGLIALLQVLTNSSEDFGFTRRLEWMTYDWRVRLAFNHPGPAAPNLGFVFISDETVEEVLSGRLGYSAGLYWPRHIYGHLLQELGTQGAEAVAFDVLLAEMRPDHTPVELPDGTQESSDYFLIHQLQQSRNVVLAAQNGVTPPDAFRTNAWALGNIEVRRDSDGILRRARAFADFLVWHPMIVQASRRFQGFQFDTNRLLFPASNQEAARIPIDLEGNFDQGRLYELSSESMGGLQEFPANVKRVSKAYSRHRVWNLGVVLAARNLKLDLSNALVEPGRRIVLRGPNDVERVIPIDHEGRFYIDWSLPFTDRRLTCESFHSLLHQQRARALGKTNDLSHRWHDKLVLVGSVASGNDLTDLGATPLEKETYLTSSYWNIANSLILGRFTRQPRFATEFSLILLLGFAGGLLTWNLRALIAASCVLVLAVIYLSLGVYFYLEVRYWLPLILPCSALCFTHFTLISYRVVFEQRERRRIRNIFAKIVSPNVVNELLKAEKLSLGGARREVTVFFSDVRGFTEMTDESHAKAEEYVRERKLSQLEGEAYCDEQAQEVLRTVNLYLGRIADTVKQNEGTLDKYIGDCVMAFWGAPTPNEHHALGCVQAAIDAQRAIHGLNQQRAAENKCREKENLQRAQQAQSPLPPLKLLSMGSGINTGIVTVGLMGSEQHTFNYTVFGRDVNL
ncbi:MAG TPA: CHASE2 domain-containing protein, partial [Candidatus Binatia bacterium]|nr:CHASE2 domain-containing protein [Candidatus Binatia bacterium]